MTDPTTDGAKERLFEELVRASWSRSQEAFRHQRIDDVLLGAAIASTVRSGFALIGLNSDGVNHHLRFEHLGEQTRVMLRLTHLSEGEAPRDGHLASMVCGYGERVEDAAAALQPLRAETASLFATSLEPGVVSFAADPTHGYLYVQIALLVRLDDYLGDGLRVDLPRFQSHVESLLHGLRVILRGRGAARSTAGRSLPRSRSHLRELRESRDEIVMGEVVAAMGAAGRPVVAIASDVDFQRVRFLALDDPALQAMVVSVGLQPGDAVTLTIQAERKARLASPAELARGYPPPPTSSDGVQLHREMASLFATTRRDLSTSGLLAPGGLREAVGRILADTLAALSSRLDIVPSGR